MTDYLGIALPAAQAAARAIMKYYKTDLQIAKRGGEPVTLADTESEKILAEHFKKDPAIGYLSEESERVIPEQELFWVVDPLDGTSDFVKQTDEFVVMIGLVSGNRPIFGLIYRPVTGDYYYAETGKGAYRVKDEVKQKISVSPKNDPKLAQAFISRSHLLPSDKEIFAKLGVKKQTPLGSALKSCRIAEGKGDIYINTSDKTGKWDVCAADIIVREAGGNFTDLHGRDIDYREPGPNKNGFLASNNKMHELVLSTAAQVLKSK